jgi:hypothetical protein
MGMYNGLLAVENSTAVPKKLKLRTQYISVIPVVGIYSKESKDSKLFIHPCS